MDASYSTARSTTHPSYTLSSVRPSRFEGHTNATATPADVHNVAFSKPPIGKRGYNEDEVDAFLDLVENELTRLIEENSDLRQRVSELDAELAGARAGGVQPTQAIPAYQPEPEPEPVAAPVAQPVYEAPSPSVTEEQAIKAAKVLSLAQDTADRLTGTARAEADKLVADARANADQILSEARSTAESTVADARRGPRRCSATRRPVRRPSCARRRRGGRPAGRRRAQAHRDHGHDQPAAHRARGSPRAAPAPSSGSTGPV